MKKIYAIKTALSGTFLPIRFSGKLFRVICISLLIIIAALGEVSAQVVVDKTSSGSATGGTSLTISHTTGSGSDRLMMVAVSTRDVAVTGITYNGTPLTLLGSSLNNNNGRGRVYIYYLINPTAVTANVIVTYGSAVTNGTTVGVMTFSGVNQSTPLNTFTVGQGNGTKATLSGIPSNPSQLIFSAISARNRAITAFGTDQTQHWNAFPGSKSAGAGSTKWGSTPTSSVAYTTGGNEYAIAAVSIRPVAVSDVQVTNTTLPALNPVLGTSFTFVATVKNNGPDAATNVTLNDLLPAGLTYSTHTASTGTYTPGTGVWAIGGLANQASATLSITATVSCSDKYTNTATVTATQPDPNTGNNSAIFTLTPQNSITTTAYICPGTKYNLTSHSPCNTPPGTVVTWHTATPADVSNEIADPTQVVGSLSGITYYAAFHDHLNDCFSPTTPFTVYEYPPIVVVPTYNMVTCNGGSNGSISLNVSGGTPGYTYAWTKNGSPFATTKDISGLTAGNYQVTITDTKSCSVVSDTYIITQPSAISITPTVTQPTCYSAGKIEITVSGGTAPYTYDWNDLGGNVNPQDRFGLEAGIYTVNVTDANGCTVTSNNFTLTAATGCEGFIACNNDTASVFSVTPDPEVDSYIWTVPNGAIIKSGQNTPEITVDWTDVLPGAYQICVEAHNICGTSESKCQNVFVNEAIVNIEADAVCEGGDLRLYASGGVSYSWTGPNGFTSSNPNPVIYGATSANSGKYYLITTTAKGCTVTDSVIITVNTPPSVTGSITNSSCGVSTGAVNITVSGGTSPYTYLWSNGATTEDLTNVPSGIYTVKVSSANTCDVTKTFTVSDSNGPAVSGTTVNISCFGGNNGSISITPSGGTSPYTFIWSTTDGTGIIQGNKDQSGLSAGTYSVIVTDAGGCKGTYSVTITEPAPLNPDFVKTDINCFGGSTGSIDLSVTGGTGSYTYAWTKDGSPFGGNTQDLSNLSAGTYAVIVTDGNSCTASLSVIITQPAAALNAVPTATAVSCFGGNNGQIVLAVTGGTAPYSYLWSNSATSQNITGLSAGTYSVTVTDAKDCTFTSSNIAITQPEAALAATGETTNVSCNGDNNGAINLTVTGGTADYTYAWSNGATTEDLTGLTAGTYSVIVTDALGCTTTESFTITEPTVLSASLQVTNATCNGSSTGSIDLSVSGGTAPYTYLWSNASESEDLTGISAGYYSVLVTDSKGCTTELGTNVTQPTAISVSGAVTNVQCLGSATGAINITATGGSGSYTYLWSTENGSGLSVNAEDQTGLSAGTYTVKVTDVAGCYVNADFVISELTNIVINMTNTNVSCNGASNGSIVLNITGGLEPYTYLWSKTGNETFTASTKDISNLSPGIYTVVVTDANGCSKSMTSAAIAEPAVLSVVIQDATSVTCFGGNDGSATAVVSGGTAPFSYNWSNGSILATPENLTAGTFTVYVTDAGGCTASAQVTITQPAQIKLYSTVRDTRGCAGTPTGAIDLTVENGVAPLTYLWSNNATTEDLTGLSAGTYSVTVTDADGCIATLNDITVGAAATLTASIETSVSSCLYNSGSVYAVVSGGVQPYTYSWNTGATTQYITGLLSGNFSVTVTDADGCTATASGTLVAPVCNPPVAVNDIYNVSGSRFVSGNASTNDSDIDNTNSELEFLPLSFPTAAQGELVWSDDYDGTFTFIPTPGYSGIVVIRYMVEDPLGLQSEAIITINVYPTPKDDINTTMVNQPVSGNVLTNDLFENNVPLTLNTTPVTGPTNGTVIINADGTYVYTPAPGFTGSDSFTYQVCNADNLCATATVYIEVLPLANTDATNPPVAVNDAYIVPNDTILYGNVISNDLDVDGNLDYTSIKLIGSAPNTTTQGTLTLNADGTFSFDPVDTFSGKITFVYEVCDTGTPVACDQATVTIDVFGPTATNLTFATDDAYITKENIQISGNLLTNDYDPEDDLQTINTIPVTGTVNGTLTINIDGTFTYIPNAGFSGTDQFVYEVCDNGTPVACDQATVYLNVMAVNDPPLALNDVNTTFINTAVNGQVLTNDSDPEGDPLTVTPETKATTGGGSVTINADGTYIYTPLTGFTGEDTFTYTVCDDNGGCTSATVTIEVMPLPLAGINDAPVAVNDAYQGTVNTTVSGKVLVNDLDADGNGLTVIADAAGMYDSDGNGTPDTQLPIGTAQAVGGVNSAGQYVPNAGSLTLNTDGTFTFEPTTGFTGQVTYTYVISDSNGGTDNATVTIDITAQYANSTLAVNDATSTLLETPVSGNVIANDYDAQGNAVTVTAAKADTDGDGMSDDNLTIGGAAVNVYGKNSGGSTVVAGTLVQNANGTYTFTPATGFTGEVSYNYTICDNGIPQACDEATVVITVYPAPTAGNDPPVALNNAYLTAINTTVTGTVMPNDSDPDGDMLTVTAGTYDSNGDGTQDGTLTIGTLASPATPVQIGGVNSANQQVANAGTLTQNADGTFTFEPAEGFTGQVTYTYTIFDGTAYDTATVTIDVTGGNTTFATDDVFMGNQNMPISGNLKTNDYDPQGNTQTVSTTPVVAPLHGTVTINADGTFTYIPNPGYAGTDQFVYQVCDNGTPVACDQATVYLNVVAVNEPPVALNDVNTTFINTAVNGQVLTNDSDPDGNPLTVTPETKATTGSGSVTINADGTYIYTPLTGFTGEDTFTYTVCDNGTPALCDVATVTIEVMPVPVAGVNDAPVAVNDAYQGTVNTTVSGKVLVNDLDADGNGLTVIADAAGMYDSDGNGTPDTQLPIGTAQAVGGVNSAGQYVPNAGSLTLNTDGTFTFEPTTGFTGQVTYTYVISDSNGGTDNATVTIDITAQYSNSTLAVNDATSTLLETPVSGNVIANDYDAQGNTVTVTAAKADTDGDGMADDTITVGASVPVYGKNTSGSTVAAGSLVQNANGTYTFTPATGFTGEVSYNYTICDNGIPVACDEATVVITVYPAPTAGNDPPVALNNAYLTAINTTVTGTVMPNDSDPDGDTLTVTAGLIDSDGDGSTDDAMTIGAGTLVYGTNTSGATVSAGTLTQNADGTFTFVPTTGFTGQVTYTYTIFDGIAYDTATVTIDVTGGNTTFATDDVFIGIANEDITGDLLLNDYDPQGNTLTINTTPVTDPLNGTVTINADGTFTYTPNPGYTGTDQFIYQVCDNGTPQACDQATVYLNIANVPDVTPIITAVPNVMNGVTNFYVTVQITELNNVNTSGPITVKIPKDTRWVFDGGYDPDLTTLGTTTLNNNVWSYSSDATYHIFTTSSVISAGSFSYFGFRAIWNAGQTVGIYTITSQIVEGSGGENRIDNNVDAEKLDYFIY